MTFEVISRRLKNEKAHNSSIKTYKNISLLLVNKLSIFEMMKAIC